MAICDIYAKAQLAASTGDGGWGGDGGGGKSGSSWSSSSSAASADNATVVFKQVGVIYSYLQLLEVIFLNDSPGEGVISVGLWPLSHFLVIC